MGKTSQSAGSCYHGYGGTFQERDFRRRYSSVDDPADTDGITSIGSQRGSVDIIAVNASSRNSSMDLGGSSSENSVGVLLDWNNLGSPDEIKTWSRSNKTDMLKSYSPGRMVQSLKGVTTTEEVL